VEGKKTRKFDQSKIIIERSRERKESPGGWRRRIVWRRMGR
jgi:hypothetical protein